MAARLLLALLPLASQPAWAQGTEGGDQASEKPGLFSLGPFYVTPTLTIGTLGLDTNVFYTATNRHADFTANGGPGLDIVLPIGPSFRIFTDGGISYTYFLRTDSQRRLAGNGKAGVLEKTDRFEIGAEEDYLSTFQRPSLEVDTRIFQSQWTTAGHLNLKTFGRLGLETSFSSQSINVASGQTFLGTDLSATLNRDVYLALFGFTYALTNKTRALVEGDYELDRFQIETTRNADSNRVYAGFQIDSETRLSGRAVGGVRFFRLTDSAPGSNIRVPYANVDLRYIVGPNTLFEGSYIHDLQFSAFNTSGSTPTLTSESYGLYIDQALGGGVDLRVFGLGTHFKTDGAIVLTTPGGVESGVRNDRAWQGGVNLGYKFRSQLRIGASAIYVNRQSNFADLGIRGLLFGGTVTYEPNKQRSPFFR